MDVDRDWRARQAAQLVGTPFGRPQADIDDRTLPISGPSAAVAADPSRRGGGAASSHSGAPRDSSRRKAISWLVVVAAGVVVAAVSWLLVGKRGDAGRPAPTQIAATKKNPVEKPAPVRQAPPIQALPMQTEGAPADARPALHSRPEAPPPAVAKPSLARRDKAPLTDRQHWQATAKSRAVKRDRAVRAAAVPSSITTPVDRCVPTNMPIRDLICTTPVLAEGDRREQQLYGQLLTSGDARYAARAQKSHADFVKLRDRCKDVACIVAAHRTQNETFGKWAGKLAEKRARAAERALPVCTKSQTPAPNVCRKSRKFSLRRIFGG